MSATVAAALKKIAVSLLSDPKILKKVCAVILVLLVTLFAPLIGMMAFLTGDLEFDPEEFDTPDVTEAGAGEIVSGLVALEVVLEAIETAFTDAQMEAKAPEAQLLLVSHLYPYAAEENFADRLAACFTGNPTDEQIIEAVNAEFGTNISPEEFTEAVKDLRQKADAEAE